MGTSASPNVITVVLPEMEDVLAAIPAGLVADERDLPARLRLAFLTMHVTAQPDDLEAAIDVLRARAASETAADPFGKRIPAGSFEDLAATADRALADGRLDLPMALALQYASGSIAARQGQRLLLFLGLNAAVRRVAWTLAAAEVERRGLGHDGVVELGRWLLLWTEMSSMAIGEGYRATELEMLARDAAAQGAALDELLSAEPVTPRGALRLRRLAIRYGLDADATYRVVAIRPGLESDPTPDEPGMDETDLESIAGRIDQLLRRRTRAAGVSSGIRTPLAITWRGSIVAILGDSPREWQRIQEALRRVLGPEPKDAAAAWTAISVEARGVERLARSFAELQEGLRVAEDIGRRGVIDDLAELALERLLLSDADLATTVAGRELGRVLGDQRMGEELVETLQVYFDSGYNRRETARRLHLADRTVAYRLERIEDLLGHQLEGEAGRRLNVALTLRRLIDRSHR